MSRVQNPNLKILEMALVALGPLADELVFLGGCATGLLITDAAAPPVRVTQDVDVITEVASVRDYYGLAQQLRLSAWSLRHGFLQRSWQHLMTGVTVTMYSVMIWKTLLR